MCVNYHTLDKRSLSYLIDAMSVVGVLDSNVTFSLSVSRLFHEGYIDEAIINEEDAFYSTDGNGWECEKPVTGIRELFFPKVD